MPKQSPSDPKFRFNICKEYYYAPEHMAHYQCPKHGYLCQKHIGIQGQFVYGHDNRNNPNEGWIGDEKKKSNPNKNPYFDKIIELPSTLIDKCLCWEGGNECEDLFYDYNSKFFPNGTMRESLLALLEDGRCKKTPAKFIWSKDVERWLEEGKEKVEDFLKVEKIKTISKRNNSEIELLLDLFEKNVLTKDQFLEQIKGKL